MTHTENGSKGTAILTARELCFWAIATVILAVLWAGLFLLAYTTIQLPPDEPPEAFGVDGLQFLPIILVLTLLTGTFGLAAVARILFVIVKLVTNNTARHSS